MDTGYDFLEYGADSDIAADIDPELQAAMSEADPRATITRNLETGEITLEEYEEPVRSISDDGVYRTEPYCPEGLERALPEDSGVSMYNIIGEDNRR